MNNKSPYFPLSLSDFKHIVKIAKTLYPADGDNSWKHIQEVFRQGERMTMRLYNRPLTSLECSAILFHDCAVAARGGQKQDHAVYSALLARNKILSTLGSDYTDMVCWAIAQHDAKEVEKASMLADLLAAADFSPFDQTFVVCKSYKKNLQKGLAAYDAADAAATYIRRAYGSKSTVIRPKIYKEYYSDEISRAAEIFDTLTPEKVLQIVNQKGNN